MHSCFGISDTVFRIFRIAHKHLLSLCAGYRLLLQKCISLPFSVPVQVLGFWLVSDQGLDFYVEKFPSTLKASLHSFCFYWTRAAGWEGTWPVSWGLVQKPVWGWADARNEIGGFHSCWEVDSPEEPLLCFGSSAIRAALQKQSGNSPKSSDKNNILRLVCVHLLLWKHFGSDSTPPRGSVLVTTSPPLGAWTCPGEIFLRREFSKQF